MGAQKRKEGNRQFMEEWRKELDKAMKALYDKQIIKLKRNNMNTQLVHTVEVTLQISPKVHHVNGKYHIKWEPNIVKEVMCPIIKFYAFDLPTAMERVNYIVGMHGEDYFSLIEIKP